MIVVISNTEEVQGETRTINSLFNEGLDLFHLRRYDITRSEMTNIINGIDKEYRDRIVLHQFHNVASELGITRLHFPEKDRREKVNTYFEDLLQKGLTLSTSVHSLETFDQLPPVFSYVFLSPVFNSISKPNYKAQTFDLRKRRTNTAKLIALGGITRNNCDKIFEMGFNGLALLGGIWEEENKIESFKKIKEKSTTYLEKNIEPMIKGSIHEL